MSCMRISPNNNDKLLSHEKLTNTEPFRNITNLINWNERVLSINQYLSVPNSAQLIGFGLYFVSSISSWIVTPYARYPWFCTCYISIDAKNHELSKSVKCSYLFKYHSYLHRKDLIIRDIWIILLLIAFKINPIKCKAQMDINVMFCNQAQMR